MGRPRQITAASRNRPSGARRRRARPSRRGGRAGTIVQITLIESYSSRRSIGLPASPRPPATARRLSMAGNEARAGRVKACRTASLRAACSPSRAAAPPAEQLLDVRRHGSLPHHQLRIDEAAGRVRTRDDGGLSPEHPRTKDPSVRFQPLVDEPERALREIERLSQERKAVATRWNRFSSRRAHFSSVSSREYTRAERKRPRSGIRLEGDCRARPSGLAVAPESASGTRACPRRARRRPAFRE